MLTTVEDRVDAGSKLEAIDKTFRTWDGAELFYRAWLPARPMHKALVLVHRGHEHSGRWQEMVESLDLQDVACFAHDMRGWEPQIRHFSRRYRCIAFNARGYPPSEVPRAGSQYSQAIATESRCASSGVSARPNALCIHSGTLARQRAAKFSILAKFSIGRMPGRIGAQRRSHDRVGGTRRQGRVHRREDTGVHILKAITRDVARLSSDRISNRH